MDILVPGSATTLNLPHIPPSEVVQINGVAVVSLSALLLLKLKGWDDHRNSERVDYQMKARVDAYDLSEMLQLAVAARASVHDVMGWLDEVFLEKSAERVGEFNKEFGWLRTFWELFGYEFVTSSLMPVN